MLFELTGDSLLLVLNVFLYFYRIVILSQAGWRERTFANLFDLECGSFTKCEISLHFLGAKTPVIKQEITQDTKKDAYSEY